MNLERGVNFALTVIVTQNVIPRVNVNLSN